ncbi:ribosomal protein S5/elongation factor G/III/V family protein [Tanacetum coccineum]
MGPDDVNDTKIVQRTAILMGKKQVTVGSVPCGNIVALFGLDQWVTNNATITMEMEGLVAHQICDMKFSVSPFLFFQVTVNCEDLHNLSESLKRLLIFDPSVAYTQDNTKFFVAGNGEFHLQISKNYLEDLMGGVEIKFSELFVSYRETVLKKSVFEETSRRMTNGQNLFCMEARPLEDGLAEAIDDGDDWSKLASSKGRRQVLGHNQEFCSSLVPRGVKERLFGRRTTIGDSQRTAHPRLLEPKYLFEVLVPETELGEDLGAKTKGQALLQCLFDHWDIIEADPFDQSSVAGNLVRQIRKRKGLEAFYEVLGGVEGEGVGRDEVAMGRGGATVDPGVGELATAQRRKI